MNKTFLLFIVLLFGTILQGRVMRTAFRLPGHKRSAMGYQQCVGRRCQRQLNVNPMVQQQQQFQQPTAEQQNAYDFMLNSVTHEKRGLKDVMPAGDVSCATGTCEHHGGGTDVNKAKASNIAQKAAQEAKAASDAQQPAAQQASHQVKVQLAEKAHEAAEAAMAALAGKQQLVDELESEVREAQEILQEESAALQAAQQEAQSAMTSAQQAEQELKVLGSAVQLEKSAVGNAETTAQGAQQEVVEKTQVLEAARRRLDALTNDLNSARNDLANTKIAANKAEQAAQSARVNAQRNRRRLRGSRGASFMNIPAPLQIQRNSQRIMMRRPRRHYTSVQIPSAA